MKGIPTAISSRVARQALIAQKHSPTLLFAGGVVGVVGTVVLACRATLKVEDVLVDMQKDVGTVNSVVQKGRADYTAEDRKKDLALIYVRTGVNLAKLYAPAIVVGSLSIAALTGSHHIMSKRNAGLTAAYAVLEKGFDKYRERVVAEFGEDKDREFRYGVEEREILVDDKKGAKVETQKRVGMHGNSIYARFFDQTCSSWQGVPEYNRIFLQSQQNYANDMLRARGHVFLNEIYDMLGMERSKEGAVVGWVRDLKKGDGYIDFGIFDGTDQALRDFVNAREGAILLDFNVDGPMYDQI